MQIEIGIEIAIEKIEWNSMVREENISVGPWIYASYGECHSVRSLGEGQS